MNFTHKIRRTPVWLLSVLLGVELFMAAAHWVLSAVLSRSSLIDEIVFGALSYGAVEILILQAANVLFLAYAFLRWQNDYYLIHDNVLEIHNGLFSKSVVSYDLTSLQSVSVEQDIWGRWFGYGTVKLYNPAWDSAVLLSMIAEPRKYQDLLQKATENQNATFLRSTRGR